MVKSLVPFLIAIVIGVAMLPVVSESVEDAERISASQSFVAEEDDATEETFTVDNTPVIEDSEYVAVEGEEVDPADIDYEAGEFTLEDKDSTTDDQVEIDYAYEGDLDNATVALLDLLPVLFILILVAGGGAFAVSKVRNNS